MAVIEKLLTMGLAKGTDPGRAFSGASGGTNTPCGDRLAWEDVQQAVALVPKAERAALYLRVEPAMVQASELADFTNAVWSALIRHERGAFELDKERESLFVRVAITEYIDPRTCRRCRGSGIVLDHIPSEGLKPGTCGLCHGHGTRSWSDNRRSAQCQVRRSDWPTKWVGSYNAALRECTSLYRRGASNFKQKLFGDINPDTQDLNTPSLENLLRPTIRP